MTKSEKARKKALVKVVEDFLKSAGASHELMVVEDKKFSSCLVDHRIALITFPEDESDVGAGFYEDFRARCPEAKGMSHLVMALLHELGHTETEDEVRKFFSIDTRHEVIDRIVADTRESMAKEFGMTTSEFMRTCAINPDFRHELNRRVNQLYRELPDEQGATKWAINWLTDPSHREIAKAFERKYFHEITK